MCWLHEGFGVLFISCHKCILTNTNQCLSHSVQDVTERFYKLSGVVARLRENGSRLRHETCGRKVILCIGMQDAARDLRIPSSETSDCFFLFFISFS
jgi:hypothetical protein